MFDVKLNKKQCQEIAFNIIADIEEYINAHQEEYEQMLLEEQKKEEE